MFGIINKNIHCLRRAKGGCHHEMVGRNAGHLVDDLGDFQHQEFHFLSRWNASVLRLAYLCETLKFPESEISDSLLLPTGRARPTSEKDECIAIDAGVMPMNVIQYQPLPPLGIF
jgi:hypothetical protein